MRWAAILALALVCSAASAGAADRKTLRALVAAPPTAIQTLPLGIKARPVQFARVVIHPADGEAWALAYQSIPPQGENTGPGYEFLTWDEGRTEGQTAAFERAFDEELAKAGFHAVATDSLFDEGGGGADLKVGVLIDDIKGRFCIDCPNILNRKTIPGTVIMTARWEVYSSLDRKVVARILTSGGGNTATKLQGSIMPTVLEGFRENVRQLIASEDFRRVVTAPEGPAAATAPTAAALSPQAPIQIIRPTTAIPLAQAEKSVVVVFASDGSGSGFLVSGDGLILTNHHVVGASRFVKLKWSDGAETLGEVTRSDARRDVAVIKADAKGRAPLALQTSVPATGVPVFALGAPLGDKFQNTLTKGIVSAQRIIGGQPYIQSDVAVTHGNSGGPLLNEAGQVVGITVSGLEPNGAPIGLNFFIPIADALKALGIQTPGG